MRDAAKAPRRSFLKRAAILLAAAGAAVAFKSSGVGAAVIGPPSLLSKTPLRLNGRHWHLYSQDHKQGELPVMGDQMVMYGELLNESKDLKLGEFYSNCLSIGSPFGPTPFAATRIEVHTFNLLDGALLGMGTSRASRTGHDLYTVVAGTGRYAGAKGTYLAKQRPQELGGDGTAEFTFDLVFSPADVPTQEVKNGL
ncbi:MAG: hypothetical protein HY532_07840 [Chloroflexi bacterium]|nr:hypothetical protein [Chloroflexota bacterium]